MKILMVSNEYPPHIYVTGENDFWMVSVRQVGRKLEVNKIRLPAKR